MKKSKGLITKICFLAGACLIAVAAVIFALWQWNVNSARKSAEVYLQSLYDLMPTVEGAVVEERQNNAMPTLSVKDTDFVGIIEVPKYQSKLPVCAQWGKLTKYPCVFSGSVYDRTMKIGATTQKGQYDFYKEISVGDALFFTDAQGNRYAYTVTDLHYKKQVQETDLNENKSDLTLFLKNVYDFEYLVIDCNVAE